MNIEHFREGFEKTAAPVKNLINAMLNSFKKTKLPSSASKSVTKVSPPRSTNYSSYLKTKTKTPRPVTTSSSNVLDYKKLKAEMRQKNLETRNLPKRKLSGISGQPVVTSDSRYPWKSKSSTGYTE